MGEHVPVPAIGFDLDMTLVDTRPGIRAALVALAEQTGRPIDVDAVTAHLGPPVAEALSPWFAAAEVADAVELFRAHMARVGVTDVRPLPGAAAAVGAARAAGHSVVVVTSKIEPLAAATLANAGLQSDAVFGGVWSRDKAGPLRASGAVLFVGDHPADMVAAQEAAVPGVGVTSGSSTAQELRAAGAAWVLGSLEEFPGWLQTRSTAG